MSMTKRILKNGAISMNLTTEQMQAIWDGARKGVSQYCTASNRYFVVPRTSPSIINLSDIRAELDSRSRAATNEAVANARAALNTFISMPPDKSVCQSNIAKYDTQIGDEKTRLINRIEKHALTAKGCPDQARVVLLSSINRIIKEEQSVIERVNLLKDGFTAMPTIPTQEILNAGQDAFSGAFVEGKLTGGQAMHCAYIAMIKKAKEVAGDD